MEFCPNCNFLLTFESNYEKLKLECKCCGFSKYSTGENPLRVSYVHEASANNQEFTIPTAITKYDTTMYQTGKLECQNKKCPSLDPANWLADPDNAPNVLLFNAPSENRSMYFYCRVCSSTWNLGDH